MNKKTEYTEYTLKYDKIKIKSYTITSEGIM